MYGTVADKEDNLVRKDGGPFSEKHFFENPGAYESVFFDKVSRAVELCSLIETRAPCSASLLQCSIYRQSGTLGFPTSSFANFAIFISYCTLCYFASPVAY